MTFQKSCISIAFIFIGYVFADMTNDYYYRPYPVLLVHGFNAIVGGTWGINTYKTKKDDPLYRLSTKINTDGLSQVWEDGDAKDVDFGEMLMKSFPKTGNIDNVLSNNGLNPQDYKDYWGDVTRIVEKKKDFDIWEEIGSYQGINHSFVEVYCPDYFNESNDAFGVQNAQFRGYDRAVGEGQPYSLSEYEYYDEGAGKGDNYGGQTQLIRIRIIQLLNEYYGPWKWVHDPTAKINIVCHSNGGLIVTNALKHDEEYYSSVYSGRLPGNNYNSFWANPNNTNGYYISGLGFRLRDHINQVITVNSPLNGSPLADKNGNVSPFVASLVNAGSTLVSADFFGPGLQGLASLIGPGGTTAFMNLLITYIAGEQVGNFDSPVMKDLGEGSSFNAYLKGNGKAPTYSDENYQSGQQIPYVNYTSRALFLTPFSIAISQICTYYGVKNMIASSWWFPVPTPWKAAPWFNMANEMGIVTQWLSESDAIVPIESQDIRSIYSDSDRKIRKRNDAWHKTTVNLNRTGIRSDLNNSISINIANAIGENQTSSTKSQITTITPTFDNIDPNDGSHYANQTHPIVKFNGFCSSNSNELWPEINDNKIISMNAATGRPNTIVGILNGYFLNRTNLQVKVNNGSWQQLTFNQDYGDFATRFVDRNNDNKIDQNDYPGGTYVFANVNPTDFKVGENIVTFKLFPGDLTPPLSAMSSMFQVSGGTSTDPSITSKATVKYGDPINAFECDPTGTKDIPPIFFHQPVKWNFNAGEIKTVYVSFNRKVSDLFSANDKVSISRAAGDFVLTKVAANPISGQFAVLPSTANGNNLFKIVLSGDQLNKISGVASEDQMMVLEMEDETSGIVSTSYIDFSIDNDAPSIRLFDPVVIGDFNNDGVVDGNDICSPLTNLPQQDCDNICSQNGLSGTACLEAKAACTQMNNTVKQPPNSFCDGIDNNFNGLLDSLDKGEFDRIQYYSPKFTGGVLTSKPVDMAFNISDNLSASYSAKKIEWRIYKVAGNNWNSANDQLVYSKSILGKTEYNVDYNVTWKFEEINQGNPDGLYCVNIYVQDQAGNEAYSSPGYFIIDTKPPEITILNQWVDESKLSVFGPSSQTFMCKFVPGNGYVFSNKYASEAQKVTAVFKGIGAWSFYNDKKITVFVNYNDNASFDGNGEVTDGTHTDGRIDPTTIFLENKISNFGSLFFVPNGHYQVTLIAKDKAGNEKQYLMPKEVVVQTGNSTPGTESISIGNGIISDSTFSDNPNMLNTTQDALGSDNSDQYNFSYTSINGDFTFIAHVKNISNSSPNAMAGIMVRKGLNDDDVHALLGDKVSGNLVYRTRMVKGNPAVNQSIQSGYNVPNVWLKVARKGDTLQSFASHDGITYTLIGKTAIGTDDVYVGYFHTPSCAGCSGSAVFGEISFTPNGVPPIQLQFQKIGAATSPTGFWNSTFDRYTLGGAGTDIWGTNDGFEFSDAKIGGNFALTSKIESLDNTNPWAKAGLMARVSLADNSIHGTVVVTSSNGAAFQYRAQTGGTSASTSVPGYAPGSTWLRLMRIGDMLYGYAGADTNHFELVGEFSIGTDSLYIGLAHTSHNTSVVGTSISSNISLDTKVREKKLISLNKPAFASSYEGDTVISGFVTDGDTIHKRWSSLFSNDQWLIVDLGTICQISGINIFWEVAAAKEYELQVSDNGEIWSVVKHVCNNACGKRVDRYSGFSNHGRYVKMKGILRTTSYGYSIYEMQIFGVAGFEIPGIKLTNPASPVTVSSSQQNLCPRYAVDDDYKTRWGSDWENNPNAGCQWITLDLGVKKDIDDVYLEWEAAYGKDYDIQVSDDNYTFTTVKEIRCSTPGNKLHTNFNGSGRYVRMKGITRGTSYGYSLFGYSVYGK